MGDVIIESAALKFLLRNTMSGNDSASSGSSELASELSRARHQAAPTSYGSESPAAKDVKSNDSENRKKRPRLGVESRLSGAIGSRDRDIPDQNTSSHRSSTMAVPQTHHDNHSVEVAHDPTAQALQFLSEGRLAGHLGRRTLAGGPTGSAIDASSLQAILASQQGGRSFQPSLASEHERIAGLGSDHGRMAMGGSNSLLNHSLLSSDLHQAAAMRANDLANASMRYAALGQLPQGVVGGLQPHGMGHLVGGVPDTQNALAAAQAQRNFALSAVAGGMAPFIDHGNPFANHGSFNQLLMRQLPNQLPHHHALGLTGRTGQSPSLHTSSWLGHQPVSADLMFARHGPSAGTFPPPNQSPRLSLETQTYGKRDHEGVPLDLPVILALPEDHLKLSTHQVLLRHQIEAFRATEEDVSTHTRGRNKPVAVNQVGIRCRHCAYVPVGKRQKGSTYFPAALLGLYQAAQNMSTTHMQCGLCSEMPTEIKQQFAHLISTKVASSGAGRPYWARAAKKLGLVDTEDGIRFIRDLPPEARLERGESKET